MKKKTSELAHLSPSQRKSIDQLLFISSKCLLLSAHFAYVDGAYEAQFKSPLLPWKPFHRSVGLCLRFNYLLLTHSKSTLKVLLKEAKQEKPVLAWQLSGYHGEEWSAAQVAWSSAVAIQVNSEFHSEVF